MADNVVLNSGSGGSTIAADDISSVWFQRIKLVYGADGVNSGDVALANGLPIQAATSATFPVTDNSGSLTVDAPVATPVFVRLSDGSAAISTLPVSLASVPSHAVTNAGTFAVQVDGNALTALQLLDDPVFTDDAAFTPATSKVMMSGFQFDDAAPDSVDEGDAGAARMSANRCQYVMLRDNAGNERGLNIDASGYLTANISGTVTVGSHAVTNAGTFAVQAAQSGTWNITNVSGTVSLPTGASTLAEQQSQTTHLGTLAGTDFMLGTDFSTVFGSASLVIATQADNTANTQDTIATSALGYVFDGTTWDRARGDSTDGLLVNLGSNNDVTLATLPDTASGDLAAIRSSVGGTLTVGSHAVTNAGTFAVQATLAAGATTIAKAEDAASANADVGVPAMAVQKATPANTATTDGDYEFLQMSAGRLWCSALIDTALPAGTNAIGKLAANSGVDIGDVDVTSVPTDPFGANADAASATGSISAKLRFIASTGIPITGTVTVGSHAVTNAGTFAVQESGGVLTALQIMDDWDNAASDGASVSGDVAHDGVDAGEPVKIGARAETSPKGITLVADADRTDLLADADGMLMVKLGTSGADHISEAVSNTDGASTAFTNFAATANTYNAVTSITAFRTDSGTSLAYIDFRDGTAGSVLFRVPLPPTGGCTLSLAGQPLFKTSANTALAFDVSSALTTVYINVTGYKTKV